MRSARPAKEGERDGGGIQPHGALAICGKWTSKAQYPIEQETLFR